MCFLLSLVEWLSVFWSICPGRKEFSCDYLIYFAPPRPRDAAMVYEAIRLEIESVFPL